MAKARKHGVIHQDRLLGSFSYGHGHPAAAADLPDLEEDDVWSALGAHDAGGDGDVGGEESWTWTDSGGSGAGTSADGRRHLGGLSAAFDGASEGGAASRVVHRCREAESSHSWGGHRRQPHTAASAPVSVPGWPGGAHRPGSAESPPVHGDFDDGGWVPPHEYLAREYAASGCGGRAATGSVFEGVGRTLKGRDMRRLRDAVWSQTGFYG